VRIYEVKLCGDLTVRPLNTLSSKELGHLQECRGQCSIECPAPDMREQARVILIARANGWPI